MKLAAVEDRLFVISDMHLGNPASTAEQRLLGFLDHVADVGASVCVNGDGFDMLQTSFARLVGTSLPVLHRLRRVQQAGGRVHYIVGNHDIALEHFLDNVLTLQLSPFLNVRSGDRLVHIEHGHLYDPFFASHPLAYERLTKLAGIALLLHADVYRTWTALTIRLDARRRRLAGDDVLAYSYCHAAAEMILHRGFDAVIFGHTHNAEHATLPSGVYVNSGNWLRGRTFVDIDRGDVTLRTWDGTGAHEVVAC